MTDTSTSGTTPEQSTEQPPGAPAASAHTTGVTMYRPAIVGLLYLLNIVLGFSVFVGVVLAYVWRNEGDTQEWEKTHFTYLIRTFWIGFVLMAGTMVMWIGSFFATIPAANSQGHEPPFAFFAAFFGMFAIWAVLAAWFCTRCILSLVKAGSCKPMPRPTTWLF